MIWAGVFKVCGIQRFLTIYLKSYFNANSYEFNQLNGCRNVKKNRFLRFVILICCQTTDRNKDIF